MSTFFGFFTELFRMNLPWLLSFFLNNLLWLFMFAALVYIIFGGKHFIDGFVFLVAALWL